MTREIASAQVLIRFVLRIVLLGSTQRLAAKDSESFESLLLLTVFYCVFAATLRREPPFGPALTHFDEAAGYVALGVLVSALF